MTSREILVSSCTTTITTNGGPTITTRDASTCTSTSTAIVSKNKNMNNMHNRTNNKFALMASRPAPVRRLVVMGAAAAASAATVAFCYTNDTRLEQNQQDQQLEGREKKFRIPIDFVDRLASKPYLQAASSTVVTMNKDMNINDINSHRRSRPTGVPEKLRILTIDVPQMKDAFVGGTCRLSTSHVFPPHVAPPKDQKQQRKTSSSVSQNDANVDTISIPQKALIHSLVQCMSHNNNKNAEDGSYDYHQYHHHPPTVEIMQASISDLNPNNVRKTRQFGHLYKYDPGKYTNSRRKPSNEQSLQQNSPTSPPDTQSSSEKINNGTNDDGSNESNIADANNLEVIEMDAPWNQYAWMEEMKLRIAGHVKFGAPMEPSSWTTRFLFGNAYKSTVPSSRRRIWDWLFFSWLPSPYMTTLPSAGTPSTPVVPGAGIGREGIDGGDNSNNSNSNNWASNKPHAVIANGAALQRVPTSLALLQRLCKQSNVPLFVIDDPRVWGGNTHSTFDEAVCDMRKQIKHNIIVNAMMVQKYGTGFQFGRMLGQIETQAFNSIQQVQTEKKRNKQQILREKHRQQEELKKQQKERSWGQFNLQQLEKKLVEYGVIQIVTDDKNNQLRQYSEGMRELIRQYTSDDNNAFKKEPDDDEGNHDTGLAEALDPYR